MDCERFNAGLPEVLAGCGGVDPGILEAEDHAHGCAICSRRLERARFIGAMLGGLDRPVAPHGVLDAVRREAELHTSGRLASIPRFARIAAAALLVAAGGLAFLASRDDAPGYRLLDVEVVVESGPAPGDPDSALEWMYGPEVPILTVERGRLGGSDGR